MKKILLIMLVLLLTTTSAVAYDIQIGSIYYDYDKYTNTASVTYKDDNYNSYSGDIVIPSTIKINNTEFTVKVIKEKAFRECAKLKSVTIPNTITTIGDQAFALCTALTEVTLPSSLNLIGSSVFQRCTSLKTFYGKFSHPSRKFLIKDGVLIAFAAGADDNYINIPNTVTTIGEYAFASSKLETVNFPSSVTTIKKKAFFDCEKLNNVILPHKLTTIEDWAFEVTWGLSNITIPSSVTYIGKQVFGGCEKLKKVTLLGRDPSKITLGESLFDHAFDQKPRLYVPRGCKSFYESAEQWKDFSKQGGINELDFDICETNDQDIPIYYTINSDKTLSVTKNYSKGISRNLTVPSAVISGGVTYLVTAVEAKAFAGNSTIASITLPESLRYIHEGAFIGSSLESFTMPTSTWYIHKSAFQDCPKLNSITLSDSPYLTTMPWAFKDCAYAKIGSNWENGALYIGNHLVQTNSVILSGKYEVKEGTISLGYGVFANNQQLTEVILPSSIKNLSYGAFENCKNLKSITIHVINPKDVTIKSNATIPTVTQVPDIDLSGITLYVPKGSKSLYQQHSGFKKFGNIQEADFPYDFAEENEGSIIYYKTTSSSKVSVIYHDKNTYNSYSGKVVIPQTVTHDGKTYDVTAISARAFMNCPHLTSVSIPTSITSIGGDAFGSCTALTTVTIPKSVTSIEEGTFMGCTALTKANFPGALTSIDDNAFWGCSALKGVTIPANVTKIGHFAFKGCSSLATVKVNNAYPANITMGTDVFSYKGTLFIPVGSKSRYQAIDAWSGFAYTEMGAVYDFADTNEDGVTIYYRYNSDDYRTVSVTYKDPNTYNTYSGNLVIPSKAYRSGAGYSVTGIDAEAFKNCSGLTALTIPETVTSIGRDAFAGSTALYTITVDNVMPEEIVTSDEGLGFSMPQNLVKLIVPKGSAWRYKAEPWNYIRTRQEMTASYDCATKDKYGNRVYLLYNTDNGTPALHVTYKDTNYNSYPCTNFAIPESAQYEGQSYPITAVGDNAFKDCVDLKSVEFPETITTLGTSAFENCSYLSVVSLPKSLITIGEKAFKGCESLVWMAMPDYVTTIGVQAFSGCTELRNLTFSKSLSTIEKNAFARCNSLYTLTIPTTVTHIGLGAFRMCSNLALVNIPGSVKVIGDYAFENCENLNNLTMEGGITTIGFRAFSGCTSLTSVTIPHTVSTLGAEAFGDCDNLKNVTSRNLDPESISMGENVFLLTQIKSGTLTVPAGSESTYRALDQWKDFGSFAEFANNYDFVAENSDDIPIYYKINDDGETVAVTYMNASYNSYSGNVMIPATVVNNGKSYVVNEVGFRAFYGCYDLTSVTVPENVTKLGNLAFRACTALTEVNLPNSLTLVGPMAFEDCSSLQEITIPENVTELGSSAFDSCRALERVQLPESLTELGSRAFYCCTSLRDITLPAAISNIRYNAFMNCSKLGSVTVKNPKPENISLGEGVFTQTPLSSANRVSAIVDEITPTPVSSALLYVPKGATSKYDKASQWMDFAARAEIYQWQLGDANGDGTVNVSDIAIIIDYMLERNPNNFDDIAADVNEDEKINVIDISSIIQILLAK